MSIFDRLKNIIRANVNEFNYSNEELDSIDAEYENLVKKQQSTHKYQASGDSYTPKPNPAEAEERKHYAALGLMYGADFEKIKAAYKGLMKQYHPDKFQNQPDKLKQAQEQTQRINIAYTYFKNKFNKG
ncbi:MAG: hypothetical protein EAZ57_01350 [Cytophagales bacterium]|nr:MAG: hypothetical protein EAZ67_01925 [Cytophagales bacterium]TAF62096.1 MAG: hypothetical protein EAZ57_01350 [Cytophagales bacterium]